MSGLVTLPLKLRAVAENADWAAYCGFFQQQRHQRLYGLPWSAQDTRGNQALADPGLAPQPPPAGRAFIMPTIITQRTAQPQKRAV